MRRCRSTIVLVSWLSVLEVNTAAAGVVLAGRVFDGEETAKTLVEAMRRGQSYNPELKVPLAAREIQLELIDDPGGGSAGPGSPVKSWKATTDIMGSFSVDTGLEKWPEKAFFVVRSVQDGTPAYSTFLRPSSGAIDVNVYPTTDATQQLGVKVKLSCDIFGTGDQRRIRVRFGIRIVNQGGQMYVGRKTGSGEREIWRIPLPADAQVLVNTGPYKDVPGWKLTGDKRGLVLDTPIPGAMDFSLQENYFEVHYVVPARQRMTQSFPVPIDVDPQSFLVWCPHEAMSLESAQLKGKHTAALPDPFSGENRSQDVIFSSDPIPAGTLLTVVLNADNVALGQLISLGAVKWVGGFVLACVLGILLGLALGPRELTADALLESLSGEEVLDRIADLDLRRSRGEIGDKEHQRLREPLVALAAEEMSGGSASPALPEGSTRALPDGVRAVLQRIEEIEKGGLGDPAQIAERAHLLEALAKALRREGTRG